MPKRPPFMYRATHLIPDTDSHSDVPLMSATQEEMPVCKVHTCVVSYHCKRCRLGAYRCRDGWPRRRLARPAGGQTAWQGRPPDALVAQHRAGVPLDGVDPDQVHRGLPEGCPGRLQLLLRPADM